MVEVRKISAPTVSEGPRPAIHFLVESALKTVISSKNTSHPRSHHEWISYLTEALISESDTPYQSVVSSMITNGISSDQVFQHYIPDAARMLGEMWVSDQASFVDVTIGSSRLQKLFRSREDYTNTNWFGRRIPTDHSVLMVLPRFEEHSLGAFVAADDMRSHGLWVHMGITFKGPELVEIMNSNRFSMLGISLAMLESLDKAAELFDFVRKNVDDVPPIVIGGRVTELTRHAAKRAGADHQAKSAREAIDLCGLASVSQSLGLDELC